MPREPHEKVTLSVEEGVIGIRHASCPKGCNLMDPTVLIHGLPSIRLGFSYEGRQGVVRLDPLYGRFENILDWDLPVGSTVEFSCPGCGESLRVQNETCQACAGPLFALHLPSGIVEGCLRNGCHYHKLTIVDNGSLMDRLFSNHHLDSYL